jgi:hypothetical protein
MVRIDAGGPRSTPGDMKPAMAKLRKFVGEGAPSPNRLQADLAGACQALAKYIEKFGLTPKEIPPGRC